MDIGRLGQSYGLSGSTSCFHSVNVYYAILALLD
ncbi:hypothetical protein BVRB_2g034130 [Beta vulgaris subsp. vulgaris]|nr:hypothetical protein BVRB_2g034130 [Beta vulgaris subsp. vulgaris]